MQNNKWLLPSIVILVILIVFAGAVVLLVRGDAGDVSTSDGLGDSSKTIFQVAQSNSKLSSLIKAVGQAELTAALSEPSVAVTVFAPTDEAFSAIQASVDELMMPENQELLISVLNYHIVDGKYRAADLRDGMLLSTLQGKELLVRVEGTNVYVDDALVSTANVAASNGIVHIIDKVLLP
ncbi:MAG: fasciclin domain-containing protein [Candidatus Doudnabacteria bacterium]|nr:fasciclin domain-containing protein [Candidatus Doudnabacteria bacterium]